uniref:Uncharacterized protein n=1 Tax=Knipowitschia caucasica TaxID=637954 RepID=A0AAV2IZ84_KNICA
MLQANRAWGTVRSEPSSLLSAHIRSPTHFSKLSMDVLDSQHPKCSQQMHGHGMSCITTILASHTRIYCEPEDTVSNQ